VSEHLALCKTFGLFLPGGGVVAFLEGVDGPADRREGGPVLTRHGWRLNRSTAAAEHGAHGVIAEPLPHGSRELPQLRADRFIRRDVTPQFRAGLLIRRRCQRGHGGLRLRAELRDGRGIGLALRLHAPAVSLRGPGLSRADALQAGCNRIGRPLSVDAFDPGSGTGKEPDLPA
jgi:hypothetical protein